MPTRIFFPEEPGRGAPKEAKLVCAGCNVKAECLAYALRNNERDGIWGGLTDRERRKYLKALGGRRAIRGENSVEAVAQAIRLAVAV